MERTIPARFLERLKAVIPQEEQDGVVKSFFSTGSLSVRINTLKIKRPEMLESLRAKDIIFKEIPWAEEALILEGVDPADLGAMNVVERGFIYRQGLSSMLPVVVLDPRPGERILDMCAAPGSKATQMAARMGNKGKIVCIERVRDRYYRLKSVVQLMDAQNMSFHLMDARRYSPRDGRFDKILVDAPCSSEGRFKAGDPKTFAYWSPRKIKEMARKQKGLLLAASRLLRPGGTLVYATCTFAPEENESAVDWLLQKTERALEVVPIRVPGIRSYPAVTQWEGRAFNVQVKRCLRVLPAKDMEGFFIARLKKNH